jgi:membrane protein insertase Oxa1/YidC/SpoIIIJ
LWIKDLARPDGLLAVAAALLTCLGMAAGGASPSEHRSLLLTVSAVVTMVTLWKMAAGVGLYWGLSSLFGAAQGWVVHTRRPLLRV